MASNQSNPNTMDFKQTWDNVYEVTHYKAPGYKAIADESIVPKLQEGQQFHRTYTSDIAADDMGGDGGYNTTAVTDSDESITVNKVKQASFSIKKLDEIQAHLPVRIKYARKSMNSLFQQIDGDVFLAAYQGAGSIVDNGSLGGTTGTSITPTVGNIQNIFGAAETQLRLNNVIYRPEAVFAGSFKLDSVNAMPVSVLSAQLYNTLLLYLGGKTSALGDEVSRNGFIGKFFGFNCFVNNNLAWTARINIPVQPTDGDTVTLLSGVSVNGVSQAITLTFKTTLGSTSGQVLIGGSAVAATTNLVALLNLPYTATASKTVPFNKLNGLGDGTGSLTVTQMQQRLLSNVTAVQTDINGVANASGTYITLTVGGMGNVPIASVFTSGSNSIPTTTQTQHCIFGVTKSISVVIQRTPMFEILQSNPASSSGNSGRVAKDFVTWVPYGIKVFADQAPQLIDIQINTSTFTSAPVAQFN